ncbi:hypothetical protein VC83_05647 [Pseudogymnoascus destructans]|uniref:Uncharacterized protein n=1 Tax=Pseudogymnoascus destructans TaxID=655981 RepID=A0A177A6N4_9PEZI|nr:uncharacterized protein VC83_05647 [Pseudogymnoascus destructans]OAF57826.1 hypothetical protein VC83_05647 [Pseudogymnoascus destructans]
MECGKSSWGRIEVCIWEPAFLDIDTTTEGRSVSDTQHIITFLLRVSLDVNKYTGRVQNKQFSEGDVNLLDVIVEGVQVNFLRMIEHYYGIMERNGVNWYLTVVDKGF